MALVWPGMAREPVDLVLGTSVLLPRPPTAFLPLPRVPCFAHDLVSHTQKQRVSERSRQCWARRHLLQMRKRRQSGLGALPGEWLAPLPLTCHHQPLSPAGPRSPWLPTGCGSWAGPAPWPAQAAWFQTSQLPARTAICPVPSVWTPPCAGLTSQPFPHSYLCPA